MSKLILIDGNAILHRAFHALPPLTTKRGEPINAVYGLILMLLRVIQDLKPTHVAVAFDRPEPTFRHKEFPKYQAQRPPMEKDLSSQFEKAKGVFSAMNIPVYEMAGFEADDIIGTLSSRATEISKSKFLERSLKDLSAISKQIPNSKSQIPNNLKIKNSKLKIDEVIIVTGDRDILQLVDDNKNIRVYLPIRGLSDAKLMKENDVVEKLGVAPEQIPDYKALAGDPSDNYPGVNGIGPKTAVKLLEEFKNLENIYKNLSMVNPSLREKLEKGREDAFLSLKLARIITDVKFESDLGKTKEWQVDSPQLLNLFASYGFKTLTNRVKEVGKSIVDENQMRLI